MTPEESKSIALAILRRRIAAGWSRDSIIGTTFEGRRCSVSRPDYLMRAGKITVGDRLPWPLKGGEHTFSIRALIEEIDAPQTELFA